MTGKSPGEVRSRGPKGPTKLEIRAEWARAGEVDPLWRILSESRWDDIDGEDVLKLLVQALEVRSKADPAGFAADVMARLTVLTTALALRGHLHLARCVEQDGRAVRMRAQPPGDLPRVAVESLVPRLVEMQEHLSSLFLAQASVARQWALIEKSRAKQSRVVDGGPHHAGGKGQAKPVADEPPAAPPKGHAGNRIAALLNGHGRETDGVHHED